MTYALTELEYESKKHIEIPNSSFVSTSQLHTMKIRKRPYIFQWQKCDFFYVCSRTGDWLLKLSAQKHTFDHRDFNANNKMMLNALESRNISHRFHLFEMKVLTSTRWFLYSHNWLKELHTKEITTYKAMLTSLFIAE